MGRNLYSNYNFLLVQKQLTKPSIFCIMKNIKKNEGKGRFFMSKKKKIIISSVTCGIVLIGIILTIILVNIKRFDMKAQDKFDFNNHQNMTVISRDTSYIYTGDNGSSVDTSKYYAKGTEIIKKESGSSTIKMGLYSYLKNKNIIDPIYDDVSVIFSNREANRSYFKLNTESTTEYEVKIVNQDGKGLSFLTFDKEKKETRSEIKARTIDLKEKNNSVKANVNKKYHNETIVVTSATIGSNDYYFSDGEYDYEIWELTTNDGLTYKNLYRIVDDKHELVQTLNNDLGVSLESQDLQLEFLTDGTPIFINIREIQYKSETQSIEYEIYDINFNLIGKSQINYNIYEKTHKGFRIGNYLIFQARIEANEDKYDYFVTSNFNTYYYSLKTFKLNLKNANITEVKFDYYIQDYNDNFNTNTALIFARAIKNKQLSTYENLLINDKMQIKAIDYYFDTIVKISDNRYLTSANDSNFNLVDKYYNLITNLESFDTVYATENALIVKDSNQTYICNYDGIVLKKIANDNFIYLNDSHYYFVTQTRKEDDGTYTDYYIEELGLTEEKPFFTTKTPTGYKFNGTEVDNIILVADDFATLIFVVNQDDYGTYTYTVYNTSGTNLGTITSVTTSNYTPTYMYSDSNNVILKVDTKYIVLDR